MKRSLVVVSFVALTALLLCGAVWAPRAEALSFAPHTEYGVGASPYVVSVGDVTGDGCSDLVTANPDGGNVSVLVGNGSGGFSAAAGSPFAVGPVVPVSVAQGDLNADDKVDLVTANQGANTVGVLLGDGAGGFTLQPVSPATGAGPTSIAVGSFNSDTDAYADLAVANAMGSSVTVLLGDGAGGFTASVGSPFTTGAGPQSLVVDDLDGDGMQDLATGNTVAGTVSVLLGNGDGTFDAAASFATGSGSLSVVVADLNGDERPDLATDNVNANTVSVLLNTTTTGVLSFAAHADTFAGPTPYSLAGGDFNGDGKADLATITGWLPFTSDVTVLLGDGSGGIAAKYVFDVPDYQPMSIAAGDFNGGLTDLAVGNYIVGADSVGVLLNTTKSKITALKPAKGKVGATVTITGTGFGYLRGRARVCFGAKAASKYVSWSPTKIKVKVPKTTAGKKAVTVKTVEGKSNAKTFKVL